MSDKKLTRIGDLPDGSIITYDDGKEVRKFSLIQMENGFTGLIDVNMMKPFYDACNLADTLQNDISDLFKSKGCSFYTRKTLNETFGNYSWWLDSVPYTIPGILIGGDKYPDKLVEQISAELTDKLGEYRLYTMRLSGYQIRLIRKRFNLSNSEIPYGISVREINNIYRGDFNDAMP